MHSFTSRLRFFLTTADCSMFTIFMTSVSKFSQTIFELIISASRFSISSFSSFLNSISYFSLVFLLFDPERLRGIFIVEQLCVIEFAKTENSLWDVNKSLRKLRKFIFKFQGVRKATCSKIFGNQINEFNQNKDLNQQTSHA